MLAPVFYGRNESGTLHVVPSERARQARYLEALGDCEIEYVIRKRRSKRSVKQLRWWRGIGLPLIARELGYDKHEEDSLHYAILAVYGGTTTDRITGQTVPNIAHSGDLSTKEMAAFIEWVVRWASTEHGIYVPLPNEAELAA